MENEEPLKDALSHLEKEGYKADFEFEVDTFALYGGDLDMRLDPEDFHVDEIDRVGDNADPCGAVLYAISTTSGAKGVIIDNNKSSTTMTQSAPSLKAEQDPRILVRIREFLKALNAGPGKPIEQLTPGDARKVLVDTQASVQIEDSGIEESERTIRQDGVEVRLHIVRPVVSPIDAPVFIFIHGGGWVLGDYPTHRRLVRDLVVASGAVAVFPDYTPSPEARYPLAINQIYAALKWVSANGRDICVNGDNIAIVGNSVGGNMTAAVALMAKAKGGPTIKLQVMLWPVTDANFETGSYNELGEGRFLTKKMMIWFWNNYCPEVEKRKEIYASPLQATPDQLKGLPATLIQTAENDVLRDEGEAFARKLDEAGVPVTLTRYGGLIHDYGLLNPIAYVPAVQMALLQAAAAIKKALHLPSY